MAAEPPAGKIKFGDWLPDQPDLDNPGLVEALNLLPVGDPKNGYKPYSSLATFGSALSTTTSTNLVALLVGIGNTSPTVYVITRDTPAHIYQNTALAFSAWTDYSPGALNPLYDIVQYNNLVIVADGTPGAGTGLLQQDVSVALVNFALISNSPIAQVLGVVGQFVLAGNIYTAAGGGVLHSNLLQWSAIGAPTNWPTPGSAAAIAAQAGQQFLHLELGAITGIFGGDQWGVVFQQNGITRMTYTGGSTVWQFDTLSTGVGMDYPHAGVKVGGLVYFCCSRGFFATDGVSLLPIGENKVNLWFITNVVNPSLLSAARVAVDCTNKLIYWSFTTLIGSPLVVVYNYQTERFTHASDSNLSCMVQGNVASYVAVGLTAIGLDSKRGTFTATPGTATITTAEIELNPGGKALVQGFRPQISGGGTVTCRIGSRMKQSDSVTYTAALTPNSVSGFADTLVEASYHRAETDIVGNFTQAIGGEFLHTESGAF